jgi:hypothetical protein
MSNEQNLQGSLFEEDYLLRTLGGIGSNPETALTELVANAWDAGATRVNIEIPGDFGRDLVITDDGTGLTAEQFRQRWMTLGYNRLKHQGSLVEFPNAQGKKRRRAYGRNGVGRHGLLCFSDQYSVQTIRGGQRSHFVVAASSGKEPFVILSEEIGDSEGHGTTLTVRVRRNLPYSERVREILSARFLHDPEFTVSVNGKALHLSELKGLVYESSFIVSDSVRADLFVIDSTQTAKTSQQHGIAFWVGGRLVGEPSWSIGDRMLLDRRTTIAKRHTVVIRTDDLFDQVMPDWSAFRPTAEVEAFREVVFEEVNRALRTVASSRVKETTESVIREHGSALRNLTPLGQHEVTELVNELTFEQPTISAESLSLAVRAAIRLEQTRGGRELLKKLTSLPDEDVEGLNRLLEDWSIKDVLLVLDEIDQRLMVIEALDRLSQDENVDELSTLHPLVAQARWLFGPEFDSPLYASNTTLRRAVQKVWGQSIQASSFENSRRRPDLVVLPDHTTLSVVGTEEVDSDSSLSTMNRVLLIELKRGGFRIGRKEMNQATDYVDELLGCGLLDPNTIIQAYVVGEELDDQLQEFRSVGDPPRGRIRLATYGRLVRTASQRLFKLKDELTERYQGIQTPELMRRALGAQGELLGR